MERDKRPKLSYQPGNVCRLNIDAIHSVNIQRTDNKYTENNLLLNISVERWRKRGLVKENLGWVICH